MIYLAAAGCLAGVAAIIIGLPLANIIGERIARREWHAADADWAVRQLASEQPTGPIGLAAQPGEGA